MDCSAKVTSVVNQGIRGAAARDSVSNLSNEGWTYCKKTLTAFSSDQDAKHLGKAFFLGHQTELTNLQDDAGLPFQNARKMQTSG